MSDSNSDSDSTTSPIGAPEAAVPVVGAISLIGRRNSMEDAISVWPNLCSPYINQHRPIDFFAVYDGHCGPHVRKKNPIIFSHRSYFFVIILVLLISNNL